MSHKALSLHSLKRLVASSTAKRPVSSLSILQRHCFAHKSFAPLSGQRTLRCFSSSQSGNVIDFNLADIGEGIKEVEILQWFVKAGDTVEEFDKICEVQSDKANVEITSRYSGVITELCTEEGELAQVGAPLIRLEVEGEVDAPASAPATNSAPESSSSSSVASGSGSGSGSSTVQCTPAVRRVARELNVDLSAVTGTGHKGRVLKEDVIFFAEGGPAPAAAAAAPVTPTPATPAAPQTPVYVPAVYTGDIPADEVRQVRGLMRTMVKTMAKANAVPSFGFMDEIVMDNLVQVRKELKPLAEAKGVKLSYLPFIIKATSLALQQFPHLNSTVAGEECTEYTVNGAHNIGIAMDTPNGLIVPPIKNCQNRSVLDIAAELNRLHQLALAGKLGASDLSGGTFSLSNIGSVGGTYALPIINVPQTCIGALGKFQRLPRFRGNSDEVISQTIMNVSWSGDHRVIDGASIANFSNLWKQYLENPSTMLFEMR